MEIEFEKEYLRELYEEGKSSDKKYRFQPQTIKQYRKVVSLLMDAPNTEFLYLHNSLHYEKKVGDFEAVWVNKQYRLEFQTYQKGIEPKILIICKILDLSNHYQK